MDHLLISKKNLPALIPLLLPYSPLTKINSKFEKGSCFNIFDLKNLGIFTIYNIIATEMFNV